MTEYEMAEAKAWLQARQNSHMHTHEGTRLLELLIGEVERLRAALVTCSDLACGDHHMIQSDRCAAIVIHVDTTLHGAVAEAAGGGE